MAIVIMHSVFLFELCFERKYVANVLNINVLNINVCKELL